MTDHAPESEPTLVPHGVRFSAVLLAILAGTGCSMMQPYEAVSLPPKPEGMPTMRLAGNAGEAVDEAERLRQRYYANLENRSVVRNATGVLAGVLSGWAIYNAVRPGDDAGAGGALRRSLRIGAVLGTLYGFRELFVNPAHESIYAEGYRSMTCLMLQSAPLLMTESTLPLDLSMADQPPYHIPGGGDMDRLRIALDKLERRIREVHEAVARMEADADWQARGNGDVKHAQAPVREQLMHAKAGLQLARTALSDGRTLARTIEASGRTLRERVAIITGIVNDQLQDTQNNFKTAQDSLKDAQVISGSVTSLGADTAADQASQPDAVPVSMRGGGIVLAGPMSAIGDLLARADSSPRLHKAAATAASAGPAPATETSNGTTVAQAATTPLTLEELKSYRNAVDAAIKGAQERVDAEAELKRQQALDKREQTIRDLANSQTLLKLRDIRNLALVTEQLYAARRPVVQEVQDFRRRTREAANTPECRELAPLRVSPNDVQRAYAGYTVSYLISQRDAAKHPGVVLQGPQDDKANELAIKVDTKALEGTNLHRVSLTIGAKMQRQTVKLVVSDGRGVASQELLVVAGGSPRGVDPPAAAPKAPASAAQ